MTTKRLGTTAVMNTLTSSLANEGSIVGLVRNETGIFWGIPYSKPPIDILRWRRPRDPARYTEPYWNATYKRPGCKQVCDQPAPEYICPLKVR